MHLLPELASHHAVSIPELLVSRDERQARQHAWLKRHPVPLVSFTVVAPGVTSRFFLGYLTRNSGRGARSQKAQN